MSIAPYPAVDKMEGRGTFVIVLLEIRTTRDRGVHDNRLYGFYSWPRNSVLSKSSRQASGENNRR